MVLTEAITEVLIQLHEELGFAILEEMPCCQDCALYELAEHGVGDRDPYIFYTRVDHHLMNASGELWLSWGADDEHAAQIVAVCQEHGLDASWDGVLKHRIHVKETER